MHPDEIIELQIERMSFGPAAVGRYQAPGADRPMVVFVEGAVPGERVRVQLTRNYKSYWEAKLVEVLQTSPERVTPPCPVFERCGGCQWQHLSYEAQLKAKQDILLHQLARSSRQSESELRSKLTIHPAQSPYDYRARLQAHGDSKGLGYFAAHSHDIVYTDHCMVAHPDIQQAWATFASTRPLAELAKQTGQFKVEWTRTDSGKVLEAINRKHGAFGFTQVNPEQNAVMVELVARLAGSGKVAFDLYGGDGNLSKQLIGKFEHIFSVDSFNEGKDPVTIKAPISFGRQFIRERSEDFLLNQRWREWGFEEIDCVISDPPRIGLGESAKRMAGLKVSRVILVSCDPSTLARDLAVFADFSVEQIHLIDMFPQTYHLETVVLLDRRNTSEPLG